QPLATRVAPLRSTLRQLVSLPVGSKRLPVLKHHRRVVVVRGICQSAGGDQLLDSLMSIPVPLGDFLPILRDVAGLSVGLVRLEDGPQFIIHERMDLTMLILQRLELATADCPSL